MGSGRFALGWGGLERKGGPRGKADVFFLLEAHALWGIGEASVENASLEGFGGVVIGREGGRA